MKKLIILIVFTLLILAVSIRSQAQQQLPSERPLSLLLSKQAREKIVMRRTTVRTTELPSERKFPIQIYKANARMQLPNRPSVLSPEDEKKLPSSNSKTMIRDFKARYPKRG